MQSVEVKGESITVKVEKIEGDKDTIQIRAELDHIGIMGNISKKGLRAFVEGLFIGSFI